MFSSISQFGSGSTSNLVGTNFANADASHSQAMAVTGGSGNAGLNTVEIVEHNLMDADNDGSFDSFSWFNYGFDDEQEGGDLLALAANEEVYEMQGGNDLKVANKFGDRGGRKNKSVDCPRFNRSSHKKNERFYLFKQVTKFVNGCRIKNYLSY